MSIVNRTVQNQVMTESIAPTVNSTSPANGATDSSCTNNITVTFSENMDTTSVTTNTGNTSCSGTIQISTNNFVNCIQMTNGDPSTSDNTTFSVNPDSGTGVTDDGSGNKRLRNLDWLEIAGNGPTFKIRVTTGVKDLSGNTMSDDNTTGTGFLTAKNSSGCW